MHRSTRKQPRSKQLQSRLRSSVCAALALFSAIAACAQNIPLTVQLDWKPTAQFAGLLAAREQGFYAMEGLDVSIVPPDDTMQTVPLVAAHPNWIGVTEADVLMVEIAKGQPVKAFATMLQTTPFALITLKSSGLTSIKSLKGKRIGLYGDGQKAIDVLLKYNGMTRRDVTIVDIPYTTDALVQGKVDAQQGYIVEEAVALEMAHHAVNVIPMSENGYVSYAELLFASDHLLHEHPDQLLRFLRATANGWNYAATHVDDMAKMIVEKYSPDRSFAEQRSELEKVLPLVHAEHGRFGEMKPETWARSLAMFEHFQLADRKLAIGEPVDYSVLRQLYGK
jgi:ABC-type nitrate/sulfonate/bicarbonate transport system substrate-binding protein